MSILEMNEVRIVELEQYLETKCRSVIDTFKEYRNTKPFTFLPGHRECIFGIKAEILKLQNNKKSKATPNQGTPIDQEDLKMTLETQLSTYANNNGRPEIDWTGSIKNLKVKQSDTSFFATCTIDCPIDECNSSISAAYNKHWKISNMFRHLRQHFNAERKDNQNCLTGNQPPVQLPEATANETIYVVLNQAKAGTKDGTEVIEENTETLNDDTYHYEIELDEENN